jgi:hypothetical protein
MPIDLNNPEHLHRMISDYLDQRRPDLDSFEKSDSNQLLDDSLKGLDSTQYLIGKKNKEVETFYDKHPIQATIHDLLNKAPVLATGVIGGQVGHSLLKDHLLQREITKNKASYGKKDGSKGLSEKDFLERPDLSRVFPESVDEVPVLDKFKNPTGDTKKHFNSKGDGVGLYSDFYHSLEPSRTKLEGANDAQLIRTLSSNFPKSSLKPGEQPQGHHFKNIVQELGKRNDLSSGDIARKAAYRSVDPLGKVKNFASHINPRIAGGAAAAGLAGMALSPLMSYAQKKIYGKPKVQEWMKNRRMTEGKFE